MNAPLGRTRRSKGGNAAPERAALHLAWDRRYRHEQREWFIGKRVGAALFVEIGSFMVDSVNDNAPNDRTS